MADGETTNKAATQEVSDTTPTSSEEVCPDTEGVSGDTAAEKETITSSTTESTSEEEIAMKTRNKLSQRKSGIKASVVGVGTAGLAGLHGEMDEEEAVNAIEFAIECGVNFIDTAPYYNDRQAEDLLKDIIAKYDRESLCIATKVCRYMNSRELTESFDFSASTTEMSVMESMKRMGLSYIDVVQIHDVEHAPSLEYLEKETIPALLN
ncbi:hypothetical protein EB796_003439 [Bugula neritina]|uniref:NADP-dependent oxidoreductase domain-containing protein n=1 Tax=Bugula neritina TaxID=10212 RepID=A0A7J7KHU8_BUGNE|nr:hypothetical protein EB796_003439 [Bugula neritina]